MEQQRESALLEIASKTPLYLSERDSGGKWEVKADASIMFDFTNVSGNTLVIGAAGITQMKMLLPVTKNAGQGFEAVSDLIADGRLSGIEASCSVSGLQVKNEGEAEAGYLVFSVEPAAADYPMENQAGFQIEIKHLNAFSPYESMSFVTVCFQNGGASENLYVPVYKKKSKLEIKKFQVNGRDAGPEASCTVGMGDTVQVVWETLGAEKWQLQPYAKHLAKAAGSMELPVWDEGPICLYISRGSEGIRETMPVLLQDGQAVESFTANPQTVSYDKTVKFQWKLTNTSHAYLSGEVGKVTGESLEWAPDTGSGTYVLSCIKQEKKGAVLVSEPVYAGRDGVLEIIQFDFSSSSSQDSGQAQYSLFWNVNNCSSITIQDMDGKKEWAKGSAFGHAVFTEQKGLTLDLLCEGEHGQKIHLTQMQPLSSG